MTTAKQSGPSLPAALAGLLAASALALTGCSGRDTVSAEQVAEANAAAQRAEKAADRAEKAAAKADKPAAVQVDADPEDITDPGPDQNQQDASAPSNHG